MTIAGHRIHYVEEGEGEPVLFIHGNPTWSFIWRNVLPAVARETGTRGIALDLLGFGRSDKPRVRYTARLHYEIVEGFIEELGLQRVTLVLQDWGGPLGALFATRHPDRVKAIALMESFLWALSWEDLGSFKWTFRALRSPVG